MPCLTRCASFKYCIRPRCRPIKQQLTSTVASPTRRVNSVDFSTTNTRNPGRSRSRRMAVAAPASAPPTTTTSQEWWEVGTELTKKRPRRLIHAIDLQIVFDPLAIGGGDEHLADVRRVRGLAQFLGPQPHLPHRQIVLAPTIQLQLRGRQRQVLEQRFGLGNVDGLVRINLELVL